MSITLSTSLTIKLASIAVHADELMSPGVHQADKDAIKGLLADPEVRQALASMERMAVLPVRRDGVTYG